MSQFDDAITGLVGESPRERISAIKAAVVDNLRAADSRMRIETTDHFNHSFVPDLILSWPGQNENRRIYLRTSYRIWDLLRDVDLLANDQPILMPLVPMREEEDEDASVLHERTKESRTLVTNPYGLEAFAEGRDTTPIVALLTHAILQGGRGVITTRRAREISGQVAAGFSGARDAAYEATSAAVAVNESNLDPHRASQMNRLLHALWIGSGAPPSEFPRATGAMATLDEEALRFVLEMPDLEDDTFWHGLGFGLTTERLCQLVDFPANANLQRLLQHSAYRLTAKACRVVATPQRRMEDVPRWSITSNTLTLQSPRYRIHFAPRSVIDLPESTSVRETVSVSELKRRAENAEVEVAEVRLSNGDATVAYTSAERPDVVQDDFLSAIAALLSNGFVASVTARIGNGSRSVRCSFDSCTGGGNGNTRYLLSELATVAAPLLCPILTDELIAIRNATHSGVAENESAWNAQRSEGKA
ncbi:hypothetical protein [Plantactinospora endophytica]|uniref:Uncharacterized protein n=1 Tax=Plantactinospora endophytica TaxID=673535 RepID=A0ABQ4E7Q0_9ACTN|nr:hypothetical protein [Plantactinospora endophytica]GIG90738.1 hypothetical protein Pen02_56740 [Plantactinospora endophytica]